MLCPRELTPKSPRPPKSETKQTTTTTTKPSACRAGSASAAAATSRYRRPPYDGAARGALSWCHSFRTALRQARAGSACCRRTAAITMPSTATSSTTDFLGVAEAARQTRCGGRVALVAVAAELEAVATGGHRVSHLWLVVRRRAPLLLARRHEGGWTCGVHTLLGRGGAPRRLRALAVPARDSINCCAMRSAWLVDVLASTWLACYGRGQGRVDEQHVCWRSGAKGGCGVTGRARVWRAAVCAARAARWGRSAELGHDCTSRCTVRPRTSER